jgi:hypothetical protein
MKWLKKNWIYLVLIALIGYLLINDVVKTRSYKREIKVVSDSLAILEHQYQELEKASYVLSELVSAYKFALTTHQDSLQDLRIEYFNQKQRYEKQVAALKLIPTDDLYIDVTGWLDSLSVQW